MTQPVVQPYTYEVASNWDVHKPEEYAKLIAAQGTEGLPFVMNLIAMGMEESVANVEYSHREKLPTHDTLKVNALVADQGADTDLSFVLHADSLDANNNVYVRLGDVVLMNSNRQTGIVSGITGVGTATVTVTLSVMESGATLGALAANELLSIVTNNWAEKTSQPAGRAKGVQKYSNNTHIVKETIEASGTEMTQWKWYSVDTLGNNIPTTVSEGTLDGEYRQMIQMGGALLFSRKTTNTIADVTSETTNPHRSTHGLVPSMEDRAYNLSTTADTFPLADLRTVEDQLDQQHCIDPNIIAYLGKARFNAMEDDIFDFFKDANINATTAAFNEALGIDSMSATLNFKALNISGRNFGFKIMNEFRHPQLYAHASSAIPQLGLYFGSGQNKDADEKMRYHVCLAVKAFDGYNRKMEMWTNGTAGQGIKIGQVDGRDWYWRSDIGFRGFALNQTVLQDA